MDWKNKDEVRAYMKEYRRTHSSKEYWKNYYLTNKKEIITKKKAYNRTYSKTQMGRAQRQFQQYKFMDKRNGFDEIIDFDARWIVDNIYTKPCAHCGETDWTKLGCNRLDNTKPHTKDNVESCCFHCNCVLNGLENHGRCLTEEHKKKISESMKAYQENRRRAMKRK